MIGIPDLGSIAVGKSADFIVLMANPLEDILNTRRIDKVYIKGVALDRAKMAREFKETVNDCPIDDLTIGRLNDFLPFCVSASCLLCLLPSAFCLRCLLPLCVLRPWSFPSAEPPARPRFRYQIAMPLVAIRGDVHRRERQHASRSDRRTQVLQLRQSGGDIRMRSHLEPRLPRQQQRFCLHRQLEFEPEHAEHVEHHLGRKAVAQLLEERAEPGHSEMFGRDQIQQLDIEVEPRTNPLASGRLAPLKHREDQQWKDHQEQQRRRDRGQQQVIVGRVQHDGGDPSAGQRRAAGDRAPSICIFATIAAIDDVPP